ncbi:hypothetical protein V6N11_030459 [Hibiscus sabdariffa]|uniref:Uncharacterized protein n=1 Tax=Hibiscus sabdariffa TaxID=183260 RepID=A0ABR2PL08_9ROSI
MRDAANILRRWLHLTEKVNNDLEKCDSLNKLFENPDQAFGSFSALYNPHSDDLAVVKHFKQQEDAVFLVDMTSV